MLASELLAERIAVVNVDPGFVFNTGIGEEGSETDSSRVNGHVTPDVPARAIAALDDPLFLSGAVMDAQELLRLTSAGNRDTSFA